MNNLRLRRLAVMSEVCCRAEMKWQRTRASKDMALSLHVPAGMQACSFFVLEIFCACVPVCLCVCVFVRECKRDACSPHDGKFDPQLSL
jgi:hypothetical protein